MSHSVAIRVENLGKRYTLGQQHDGRYVALRDVVMDTWGNLAGKLRPGGQAAPVRAGSPKEFWALRNVTFDVASGARIGIIGRNGAGKSTLLKILSRITDLSEGRVLMKGRVASLLEVGTGFHPELTGRENVFLNGAILGMTRAEIMRKFDEIVDFSGCEQFLDTPVKRYSSGMQVRLAFAVAAHLEPEVLVVDEVLAVGDAEFQRKCLGKMDQVSRDGRTVLFVSHNMGAIQQLCSECILLDAGRIVSRGDPTRVVTDYLSLGVQRFGERVWEEGSEAPGTDEIRIHAVRVRNSAGKIATEFTVRDEVLLEVEFRVYHDLKYLDVSFYLTNERGELLLVTIDDSQDSPDESRARRSGFYRSICHIPPDFLNDGLVYVRANLTAETTVYTKQPGVVSFQVIDAGDRSGARGNYHEGTWPAAAVRPKFLWTSERKDLPSPGGASNTTNKSEHDA